MKTYLQRLALTLLFCSVIRQPSEGQVGNNNPTGVTGDSSANITTAGSYDPYTGNAKRIVDDLVVTGSLGAYPLKWTRILNTRDFGWSNGYRWGLWVRRPTYTYPPYTGPDGLITYPDGRSVPLLFDDPQYLLIGGCDPSDRLVATAGDNYDLLMRDGGLVRFQHPNPASTSDGDYVVTAIIDPYGLTTVLTYESGQLRKISEPGGRYLQINYVNSNTSSVQAYDGRGNLVETVTYTIESLTFDGFTGKYLTHVQYDDNTTATYTYQANNRYDAHYALVKTCDDPRYAGVMKKIEYEFMTWDLSHRFIAVGQILKEKNATSHKTVSEIVYPVDWPPPPPYPVPYPLERLQRTEKRGDDPNITRLFQYSTELPGELAYHTDFNGHVSSIRYSVPYYGSPYYLKIFTDARLHDTTIKKEGYAGSVLEVKRGIGQPAVYTYTNPDYPYYLSSKKDENGNITYYDRDGANRVWRIRYPDNGSETFTYDYNPFGLVHEHTMTSGGTEVFEYDNRGLKISYTAPVTLSDPIPGQHKTLFFYYGGPSGPGGGPEAPTRPDLMDRLRRVIDPRGNSTWYEYNGRGQVTKVTHQDGTYTESNYNEDDGTLLSVTDGLRHTTIYTYDEYKRVLTVKNAVDKTVITSYDPGVDLSLTHTTSSVYQTTSHTGRTITRKYDENFRLIETKQAPGTDDEATSTYTYDEVGNQITVTEPNAQTNTNSPGAHSISEYDDRNRRIALNDVLGHRTMWEYDDVGNLKKETRADTKFRTWDLYDAMNRVKHTTGFLHEPTGYLYDLAGNLQQMTDCNGSVYAYNYDELNRKKNETYPTDATGQARWESWRYDIAGNLLWYKNPAYQFKHFEYDNRNRQTRSYWNSSDTGTNVDQTIGDETLVGFDDASRVEDILTYGANAWTRINYGYDPANRKTSETQTLNSTLIRHVETLPDDDGNRATLTVTGVPYSLTYDYTQRQQLYRINKGGDGPFFEYTYDKTGNLKKRQNILQGGGSTNFTYDTANRVTLCVQFGDSNSQPFARSDYNDYDLVNNVKSISHDEQNHMGERFDYDDANQLKSASYNVDTGVHTPVQAASADELAPVEEVAKDSNREDLAALQADPVREPLAALGAVSTVVGPRTVIYTNDPINRRRMNDNGAIVDYTPNPLNQYTSVLGHSPHYDANFNLSGYDGWTYGYDADKRLISASGTVNGVAHSAQFVYDGLGRCVKRTIDTVATVFTYDEWKPIVEWNMAGGFVAWNLYGPGADEILIRYQPDTQVGYIHYYLDALDNVQFLLSDSNLGLEKYTYDAFGQPRITDWNGYERPFSHYGNRFMFTGREYLYTLGIYDYRHRHYHPELGRFMQIDPVGFKGDPMNLYRYCGGNPINHSDPMGLEEVDITLRAFIPQANIFGFRGDNRGFSSSSTASSRVSVGVKVETDPAKNHGHPMIGAPRITVQPSHVNLTGWEKKSTGPLMPQVKANQDKNGSVTVNVRQNMRDPFQVLGNGLRSDLNISVNQNATRASIQGSLSGAPSFEANFTANGATTNVPLQSAPTATSAFVEGLQQTNQINITTQLNLSAAALDTVLYLELSGFSGGNGMHVPTHGGGIP